MADDGRGQPETTAGLDLGDKYSHLCLLGTESGEVTMVWDYFASGSPSFSVQLDGIERQV